MGKLSCLYSPLGGIYSLKACHVVLQIDIYPTLASVYFRVNFNNLQRKIYPSAVIFHNSVYTVLSLYLLICVSSFQLLCAFKWKRQLWNRRAVFC